MQQSSWTQSKGKKMRLEIVQRDENIEAHSWKSGRLNQAVNYDVEVLVRS